MARKEKRSSWLEADPFMVFLISFGFLWGTAQILGFILIEMSR